MLNDTAYRCLFWLSCLKCLLSASQEFELTINVEAMFKDADPDAPRSLGFEEFKILLS